MIFLANCSGNTPSPTTPAATSLPSATSAPADSLTIQNTPTTSPEPSQTPLPAATSTATQPPLPTSDPALVAVRLLGVSWRDNYDLLLAIELSGPAHPELYRVMVEDKVYTCQKNPQNENRLVCIGQGLNVYGKVTVRIYPQDSDIPGFEGDISIPYFTK